MFTRTNAVAAVQQQVQVGGRRADGAARTRPSVVEHLEGRVLLSASLRGGTLSVAGTRGDDEITVALNGASVDVTVNGEVRSFEAARVTRGIRADGRAGDDAIDVAAAFALPVRLTGGAGDDELFGASGADLINGGKGDDDLHGRDGVDRLIGGKGEDVFQSSEDAAEIADLDEDDGVRIQFAEAPAPVQASVTTLLAGLPLRNLLRETDEGETVFELEWDAGLGRSAKITLDGTVVELESEIDPATLPAAVTAAIAAKYPLGEITEAETLDLPGEPQAFEVEVVNRRQIRELVVTPAGEILDDSLEGKVGQ